MSEDATALVEGVETEAEETPAEEVSEETPEPENTEEEGTEEEDEDIEFDFGGNKLSVKKSQIPPELAEKVGKFAKDTWADYTRKSQSVAEQAKALEAQKAAVEKFSSLHGKALEAYSKGLHIRSELEQLSQVDLNALWQSEPDRARRISDVISQKRAEFQNIVSEVARQENEIAEHQKAETARLIEDGKKAVLKRIPDFEQHASEVIEYAVKEFGIPQKDAEQWALNPAAAVAMHKAMMFDRLQATAKKTAKPTQAPVKPVTPIKGKGGNASLDLVKDADKMSADEWLKRRNAQLKGK